MIPSNSFLGEGSGQFFVLVAHSWAIGKHTVPLQPGYISIPLASLEFAGVALKFDAGRAAGRGAGRRLLLLLLLNCLFCRLLFLLLFGRLLFLGGGGGGPN